MANLAVDTSMRTRKGSRRWVAILVAVAAQGLFRPSLAQIPSSEFPPPELPKVSVHSKIDSRSTVDLRLGRLRIRFEKTGLLTVGVEMHNLVLGNTPPKGDQSGYSWLNRPGFPGGSIT